MIHFIIIRDNTQHNHNIQRQSKKFKFCLNICCFLFIWYHMYLLMILRSTLHMETGGYSLQTPGNVNYNGRFLCIHWLYHPYCQETLICQPELVFMLRFRIVQRYVSYKPWVRTINICMSLLLFSSSSKREK